MMGQWSLTLMHHTRGLLFFQDLEHPSNRNAAPLVEEEKEALIQRSDVDKYATDSFIS